MNWEAFRLTSKSPSELLHTLGPHAVDHLVRQAMDVLWREYPEDQRTFEKVRQRAQEVFDRNLRTWSAIKKPSPQAFFENLLPYAADGFVRQAMVLCWMMMPRTGGRDVADVRKIIARIIDRNLEAWEADHALFTAKPKPHRAAVKGKRKPIAKPARKPSRPRNAKTKSKR
jgi:hypothetical protein